MINPSVLENEIIAMAWDDETSFDMIESRTGLAEKDVIKLMRRLLKTGSFKVWRTRVSGCTSKHASRVRLTKTVSPFLKAGAKHENIGG